MWIIANDGFISDETLLYCNAITLDPALVLLIGRLIASRMLGLELRSMTENTPTFRGAIILALLLWRGAFVLKLARRTALEGYIAVDQALAVLGKRRPRENWVLRNGRGYSLREEH